MKVIPATDRRELGLVLVLAGVLSAIRFVPYLYPDERLWGFNHLLFLSDGYVALYALAALMAILILATPLRRHAERLFDLIAGALMDGRYYFRWSVLAVAGLNIFWIFRVPVTLLGDGYSVINNIGNDLPVVYKWSEIGAVWAADTMARLLPQTGLEGGALAYAILSVIAGTGAVWLFLAIARELADDNRSRLFLFCLLIFSGWILLFFGYAENYPLLWMVMLGYVYASICYVKGRGNLALPTVLLILALVLHLQAAFYLLSYPALLFSRGWGGRLFDRHRKTVIMALATAALAGAAAFVWEYQRTLDFRTHFLPLLHGRPATPEYAVISIRHLVAIVNELLLIIPLWPIMLAGLIWSGRRAMKRDAVDLFLWAYSMGGVLFLLMVEPKIGMGRDWDLFALTGLGPLLILARGFIRSTMATSHLFPGLAVLALALTLPFLTVNLQRQPTFDYVEWLLRLDMRRSHTGMILLASHYRDQGDIRRSDSVRQEIRAQFPAVVLPDRANDLARTGRLDEAQDLADSLMRADPYSSEAYNIQGIIAFYRRDFNRAIELFHQAARLKRYDQPTLVNLAHAYRQIGDFDKMMESLRRARRLDPQAADMLEGFATGYYALEQYDSALVYVRRLLQADPARAEAYLFAGDCAARIGDTASAIRYLRRCLDITAPGPERTAAEELLGRLK